MDKTVLLGEMPNNKPVTVSALDSYQLILIYLTFNTSSLPFNIIAYIFIDSNQCICADHEKNTGKILFT